jgi:hypothetical protein
VTAIAYVEVPAWGGMAPVVRVEGSTWNVCDGIGRVRALSVDELQLDRWYPTRVPIVARHGRRCRRADGLDRSVVGAAWRLWSVERKRQILRAASMGWTVEAAVD